MNTLTSDVLYGARMLRKNPAFTIVAVITLALGIGANTAIFSLVNWLILRPLPVPHSEQISELAFRQRHGNTQNQFSIPDYRVIRSQTENIFSDLAGYQIGLDGLSTNGRADRIVTYYVTGNFFRMLDLQPVLGRLFLSAEGENVDSDPVVVLGYSYWQKRFGGKPNIVGTKVSLDGKPFTVIGVAPKDFEGPYPILAANAYIPLGMNTIEGTPRDFMENRGMRQIVLLGRLRDGVTLQQATASVGVIGQHLAADFPDFDKEIEISAYPEVRSRPQPDPNNTMVIISGLFLGLAAMVLLLACMNVANILLVRATVREREVAIRAALGASRGRLIRQLLTESILLALLGGLAGIALGFLGTTALGSINFQTEFIHLDFRFDWRVFAYAFSAALVTGILVGIVPALRASGGNLNAVLHQTGRGVAGARTRLRTALVIIQVGGSLILLIIAGLFTRSLQAEQRTNLGFDPHNMVNFTMDPSEIGYKPEQTLQFYRDLLSRVRQLGGVVTAATASSTPMGYYGSGDSLIIDGYQPPPGQPGPGSNYELISGDYLGTMTIPLVEGRDFRDSDNEKAPNVAIVNETMAKKYWPNQDPIGRHFRLVGDAKQSVEIVGVAKDVLYRLGAGGQTPNNFYMPLAQHVAIATLQVLQVRTLGDPASMIPEIERTIHSLAADLPVFEVKPMTEALYTLNGLLMFQIGASIAAVLGGLGLVLAVVGVYGVISYSVTQRTQEIGIRMALGAQPGSILGLVLRQGIVIVAAGLVLGVALALASSRVVGKFLVVSGADPLTYSTVTLSLTLVALAACYLPARRSTRVDPIVALRHE